MKQSSVVCIWFFFFTLSGCGSSDSDSSDSTGFIQIINGIEDSPVLTVEILDGDDVVDTIPSLAFQGASTLLTFARGPYEVDFFFEDPDTGFEERFISSEIDVTRNSIVTAVLTGTFADAQIIWLDKPEGDATDTDSEEIEVTAINLSDQSVAVYLGDDEEGTSVDNLVGTVTASMATDPVEFSYDDDADYHVRVVSEQSSDLIYDSDRIGVFESTRNTIVVTDNIGPDPTTISAFLVTDSGATGYANSLASSAFVIVDSVPDADTVDATVRVAATSEELVSTSLMFTGASQPVVAEANFVDVVATTSTDPGVSFSTTVSLNQDTAYSFVIAGPSLTEEVSIRANERDLRRVANGVNVHFVNTLRETDDEDSSEVDFYALRLGDSLSDTAPIGTGIEYLSGFSEIVGATPYDLVVTTGGTQSILAGPARIFPEGGERLIVVAAEAPGGGPPFQLDVVVDD